MINVILYHNLANKADPQKVVDVMPLRSLQDPR